MLATKSLIYPVRNAMKRVMSLETQRSVAENKFGKLEQLKPPLLFPHFANFFCTYKIEIGMLAGEIGKECFVGKIGRIERFNGEMTVSRGKGRTRETMCSRNNFIASDSRSRPKKWRRLCMRENAERLLRLKGLKIE